MGYENEETTVYVDVDYSKKLADNSPDTGYIDYEKASRRERLVTLVMQYYADVEVAIQEAKRVEAYINS